MKASKLKTIPHYEFVLPHSSLDVDATPKLHILDFLLVIDKEPLALNAFISIVLQNLWVSFLQQRGN